MAGMKQLDLLAGPGSSSASEDDEQAPAWHELELRGRRYRWRVWIDRIRPDWFDQRDQHHPKLWYRPPGSLAYDVEFRKDGEWKEVRYYDRLWEIWQHAREERPWE